MEPTSNKRHPGDEAAGGSRRAARSARRGRRTAADGRRGRTLTAHSRNAAHIGVSLAIASAMSLLPADAAHAQTGPSESGLAAFDSGAWVVPAQAPDEETVFLALRPAGEAESGRVSNLMVVNLFQLAPPSRHQSDVFAQLTARVTFNDAGTAAFSFNDRQNGTGVCHITLGVHHIFVTLDHTRYGVLGPSILQGSESFSRSNPGQSFIGAHVKLERLSPPPTREPASRYGGDWVWKSEQYRPRILGGLDLTLSFSGPRAAHFSLWQTSPFASQTAHIGANLSFSSDGVARFSWSDSAWGDRGVGVLRLSGDQIVLTLKRTHGRRAAYGIFPGSYVFV